MKRPLSLLEVCIGLALTTILLTTLFSGFRHLMKIGANTSEIRHHLHPHFVMQMRLNQIFESISEGSLLYTDAHEKASGTALYFTFHNRVDPDPAFCGEVEAVLYYNKQDELILTLKNERKETLLAKATPFKMLFFDPKEKEWVKKWKKDTLPPLVKIQVKEKTYSFLLPRASRNVRYP